ncbi:MAG TPA: diacylglycerol kinase family protein [Myxococcales bacterium]|nr:diacylglycerol kinase family protein [Myxococcales bacterium]
MATPIAALLNGRAGQVTAAVVRALRHALPDSTILVSDDLEQARRHVRELIKERPEVVLCGGGDGTAVRLLNIWREEGGGELPTLGILRLGTGNAWARAVGAPRFSSHVRSLARLGSHPLPTQEFALIEVENHLCHMAGVGWDARILSDYQRNLDEHSAQIVSNPLAKWVHKGAGGYLYSLANITIPEEWTRVHREGHVRVVLENLGPEIFGLDDGTATPLGAGPLYEGPLSVGAASSVAEWGYGLRAFPYARLKPGFINVRIYGGHVADALWNAPRLWRGLPVDGLHDWFATAVRMRFSRPMPCQIAGDPLGERTEIAFRRARETVRLIDWATWIPDSAAHAAKAARSGS